MTEEQQAAKYISGLKYPIQEHMILHDVFSVDEAHNKTMKIEMLQNRASPFKSVAEKTSSNTRTQQSSTSGDRPPAHKATDAPTAKPVTTTTPLQRARRIHTPSQMLASITGVVNLNTSPMSVQRGGKSTWRTLRMKRSEN